MIYYIKIPYQKIQLAINAYLLSDFINAIQYFNSAELDADDILKKEIPYKIIVLMNFLRALKIV